MVDFEKKEKQKRIIHVAILSDEPLGWASGKHYFPMILNDYSWQKNNFTYQIKTTYITDKGIINGLLKPDRYDVLLVPGGGVGDGEAVAKGFTFLPRVNKWKKHIQRYIQQGGSYIGICGGAALCTPLQTGSGKHETLMEKLYHKSAIGISKVTSYYKDLALPIFCLNQRNNPEKIGAMGYIFSFAPGKTEDDKNIHTGGVPIDFSINKKHPIFQGLDDDEVRIRWWGGPALLLPEKSDRTIDVIASYPTTDLSENKDTTIYAWKYIGGLRGLLKGVFSSFKFIKDEHLPLKYLLLYAFFLSGDWQKTDHKIKLDHQHKASITAEIYPNDCKGRIILCTSHPEYMIWWNGRIHENNAAGFHHMGHGFHQWNGIKPLTPDLGNEFTYTWWVVRRFVAWAAKVPDDHMPPIELGQINKEAESIIKKNILWDGTLLDQMDNI